MFSRIQNALRCCLLSYGVARNGKIAVAEPVPEMPVATSHADDASDNADDQLTAWEQDRTCTLQAAQESEQQGLRQLTKAALLRLVVHFEDEGMFVVAHELRQQADNLGNKQTCVKPLGEPVF